VNKGVSKSYRRPSEAKIHMYTETVSGTDNLLTKQEKPKYALQ